MSTAPSMADTAARRHYAGDRRPVAVKQTTWEEPGAHPKHVEGDGRAGGTTDRRVDGHSDHGGARIVGGGVPATVVHKTVTQLSTKHHGIMAKLNQDSARSETHHRALATVKRDHR